MTVLTDTYPDPTLPGVDAPFFSHWRVSTPERQRATVEAITAAWLKRPWPTDGLLGYHVYASTDGELLLHYSQFVEEAAHGGFVGRRQRDERVTEIDAAVPGIERRSDHAHPGERLGLTPTSRYRSSSRRDDEAGRAPGCVVLVDVALDGPDGERQRAWADAVLEASADDPDRHAGELSAHLHTSKDGTRVLNYTEWEDEQAHIDALAARGDGIGSPTAAWRRVREFPGLTECVVRRYRLAASLRPR